jgi:DNA-binding Lrp family transcriptional regulator
MSRGKPQANFRGADGEFEHSIENARLDTEAAELRSKGWGYQRIADHLGVSVSTAHNRVRRAIARVPVQTVTEWRSEELVLLESAMKRMLLIMRTDYPVVRAGAIVKGRFDPRPNIQAAEELRRLSESRRKLLGTDAPAKIDVTVDDKLGRDIDELLRSFDELGVKIVDPSRSVAREAIEA